MNAPVNDPDDLPARLGDHVRAVLGAPPRGVAFRRLAPSPVDARLFLPRAPAPAERDALAARLAADPDVAEARVKGDQASLRFRDEHAAAWLARLEAQGAAGLFTRGPLAGRSAVVNFLNPNATKPLHVGHLRNVALGESVAAVCAAAGARVVRQAYACDIGRNVCEALAGWEARGHAAPDAGERPDVFVGRCYAEYAAVRGDAPGDDPIGAEGASVGDRADELMAGWLAGEPAVLSRWRTLSGWAIEGQRQTLARLGVAFDRVWLESAAIEPVRRLAERGLANGVLERAADGSIHFPTGRSDYARLPLVRADGFPTEHARVIGLFVEERRGADPHERWIVVCGDEWSAAGEAELAVAARLEPTVATGAVEVLAHGMVTLGGSKMKSRDGRALLLDALLDRLEAEPAVVAVARASEGRLSPAGAAQLLARGAFLCRKPVKGLEFDWSSLVEPAQNPAWAIARAWARASDGSAATADDARTALLQAHQLRQLVALAADDLRPEEIAMFAHHVAAWSLDRPASEELVRAVRAVLGAALEVLAVRPRAAHSRITTSK